MNFSNLFDIFALAWFFVCWLGYTFYSRHRGVKKPSLSNSLDLYRFDWMMRMLNRENRIADTSVIGNLERNGAFFASSCMLILAGILTALGYTEEIIEVFSTFPFSIQTDVWVWELRMGVLLILFVYAFFKFTWSMRVYNMAGILIGSAPSPDDPKVSPGAREALALNAAKLCNQAGDAFNLGLRSYYYALAVISWFVHPFLFIAITAFVVYVLFRREFKSDALLALRAGKTFEDIANFK